MIATDGCGPMTGASRGYHDEKDPTMTFQLDQVVTIAGANRQLALRFFDAYPIGRGLPRLIQPNSSHGANQGKETAFPWERAGIRSQPMVAARVQARLADIMMKRIQR